jgi:hypothetical protein
MTKKTPKPKPLPICDDRDGTERHSWGDDNLYNGSMCYCGRFYLIWDRGGHAVSIERAPDLDDDDRG